MEEEFTPLEIKIKQINNGYAMETNRDETFVVEELEFLLEERAKEIGTDNPEKEAVVRLFEVVAETLGIRYSKFEPDNLRIDFKRKGHKL